jgi:hypothetical protein
MIADATIQSAKIATIDAAKITTGTLNADRIKAGILTDLAGRFSVNMTTGAASLSGATITGGSISIGGASFRTEIAAGELAQYALGNGVFICGLTPFSAGTEYRPTLYIGSDSRVTGFSISRLQSGNIINIAQFDKTKIDLINPVNVTGALTAQAALTVQGTMTARGLITSGTNSHLDLRGTSFISFLIGSTERGFFSSSSLNVTGALNTTGTVNTNINSANSFAAVNHLRNVSGYGNAQVKFGCGAVTANGTSYASATLEVGHNGYSSPAGRLDVFQSWGAAVMCLRGNGNGSTSGILEMGSTTLWWRGGTVSVSSTADMKSDIAPAPTALEKICGAGIYNYRFAGESRARQAVDGMHNQVGFVLGNGFTAPPAEIIGEDGESIDLYAVGAMAWKGIQELSARVAALEGRTNGTAHSQ